MALYLGDKLISSNLAGGDTNPIGSVIAFAGSNAPVGYLMCDGSAVSRETYADLFAVIGTTYGTGDGSTTFNLPNWKQEERRLLWTNPNPTASFNAQTISLGLSDYSDVEILWSDSASLKYYDTTRGKVGDIQTYSRPSYYHTVYSGTAVLIGRIADVTTTGVAFSAGVYKYVNQTASASGNNYAFPYQIYGIKETTPVIKASHSVTIQGVDTMSEAEYQDLLERLV